MKNPRFLFRDFAPGARGFVCTCHSQRHARRRTWRRVAMPLLAVSAVVGGWAGGVNAADPKKETGGVWTDPEVAAAEAPSFALQGEYVVGEGEQAIGLQLVALGDENFYYARFAGGLPGAGWDGKAPETGMAEGSEAVAALVEGFNRVERKSPTLGLAPPEGAVVLFGGSPNEAVKGEVRDGLLWAGAQTTGEFGDFTLHVEFRLPYKPNTPPSSQDRGNSGLYLQNRYEVQVLDSFGLVFDKEQNGLPLKSDVKQWCGSFYKFKTPDVPMSFPPLTWQTYDIEFTAPRFEGEKKTADARITVVHNGVKIHDDVALPKGTGAGGSRPEVSKGPIIFQGHGNPVAFRNVWLLEK